MSKETSCGIIPLREKPDGEYEVLLIQNKLGRHWSFPKGHVEAGEIPMQTAKRECREETWLQFTYIDPRTFSEQHQFPRKEEIIEKHVHYFIGITADNNVTIDPKEIKAYIWLPLNEAKDKLTFYSDRQLRSKVLKYLLGE